MPSVSILSLSVPLLTRWALTLSARLSESFWLYLWLPIRSVCPSMTTASICEQVTSFAITSRSRRVLAAGVSSDFMNAKTSSFWKVTVASHRLGTGAATGAGAGAAAWRCAGGGAGCEQDRASNGKGQLVHSTLLLAERAAPGRFPTLLSAGIIHHIRERQRGSSRRENRGIGSAIRVVREVLT